MDLDTYRRESRETWSSVGHGWEDRREWMLAITGSPRRGPRRRLVYRSGGDLGGVAR